MRMYSRLRKFKRLKFKKSKQTVAICLLISFFVISGTAYAYSVINHNYNATSTTKNESAGEASELSKIEGNLNSKPSSSESTPEDNTAAEDTSIPVSPTPQEINHSPQQTTPEVYYPTALSITEVRASGGEVCDGSTYKLGLGSALIFTNGRPGTVQWRIEGLRNGSIETVATGSMQLVENRHSHELPFYGAHYMTGQINTDTGIRFRVISPNDIASQWTFPSDVILSNPCATH